MSDISTDERKQNVDVTQHKGYMAVKEAGKVVAIIGDSVDRNQVRPLLERVGVLKAHL